MNFICLGHLSGILAVIPQVARTYRLLRATAQTRMPADGG